jgi:hypothetical protein
MSSRTSAWQLGRFQAPSSSVSTCANVLRRSGFKVCLMEDLEIAGYARARLPLDLPGATVGRVLDEVVDRNPGYRWEEVPSDLFNVFPAESILGTTIPELKVENESLSSVLSGLLRREPLGLTLFHEMESGADPRIKLDLKSTDLRRALNAIVARLGRTVWQISGRPGAYFLTLTVVPSP